MVVNSRHSVALMSQNRDVGAGRRYSEKDDFVAVAVFWSQLGCFSLVLHSADCVPLKSSGLDCVKCSSIIPSIPNGQDNAGSTVHRRISQVIV
jgi:hypothetical protein